jgi:hypothetical protein
MTAPSRKYAALLAAGLLAALSAGCGGAAATSANVTAAHHPRELGTPGGSRASALASARRVLDSLVLPAQARVDRTRPVPAGLAEPGANSGCPGVPLDVHRLYRLPVTANDAVHFLSAHRPRGFAVSSVSGGLTIGDSEMRVPAGIDCLFLVETLLPQAGGKSIVRVDVSMNFYPPRPAAEYLVASRFRSVSISPDNLGGGASIMGGQRFIRPLVAVLDSMPATPVPEFFCPLAVGPYRLVFSPAVRGQGTVVVAGAACEVASVTIGGRVQLDLNEVDPLEALVNRLLKDNARPASDGAGASSAKKGSNGRGTGPILLIPPTKVPQQEGPPQHR